MDLVEMREITGSLQQLYKPHGRLTLVIINNVLLYVVFMAIAPVVECKLTFILLTYQLPI